MPRSSPSTTHRVGDVEKAVRSDLKRINDRSPDIATSGLAATAVALAQSIDHPRTSPTARSMCAKALMDALETLNAQTPEEARSDAVDELTRRRAERRATPAS